MSLVRLLPAWLHAIADYAVATTLIVVALAVGGTSKAVAAGVVIGAVVLVVSMLTRYPLGVVKVLPFRVHSAGDYLAAVLLVASPFALGFTSSDRGLTIVYVAAGVAVVGVSLITNYQYGPQRKAVTATEPVFVPRPAMPRTAPTSTSSSWQPEARGAESWRSEPITAAMPAVTEPAAAESWRSERVATRQARPAPAAPPVASGTTRDQVLAQMAALKQQAA